MIPMTTRAAPFVDMTEQRNQRQTHTKFACVTTVTTTRTIEELKRRDPLFIQTLSKLKVYIRRTNLSTADTVEVGFFVGLHPSLTNLHWRTEQIAKAINTTANNIPLHIYSANSRKTQPPLQQ